MEKFIAKNAQIRELPLFDRPDQETLDRIAATEIPVKGRDPIAVGEELVNDLQCRPGEKGAGKAAWLEDYFQSLLRYDQFPV